MSGIWEHAQIIRKWIAKSYETPSQYSRSAWAATLSVAQTLFELMKSGLVPDLQRIKEANLRTIEAQATIRDAEAQIKLAEAQIKQAEAQILLSEAVEAANRATLHHRNDAIARAEKARLAAENAKTQAEGDAIRMDAETRRIETVGQLRATLIAALSQLRSEGGGLFVNAQNLEQILQLKLQQHVDDSPED